MELKPTACNLHILQMNSFYCFAVFFSSILVMLESIQYTIQYNISLSPLPTTYGVILFNGISIIGNESIYVWLRLSLESINNNRLPSSLT